MNSLKYSYDKDNMSYFTKVIPQPKNPNLNMDAVIPFSTLASFTNNMYSISDDSVKIHSKKEKQIKSTIDVINTSINKFGGSILNAQLLNKTIDNQSFDLFIDFTVKKRKSDNDEDSSASNKKIKLEKHLSITEQRRDQDQQDQQDQQDDIGHKKDILEDDNSTSDDKDDDKDDDKVDKVGIKEEKKVKKEALLLAKELKAKEKQDKKDAVLQAKLLKEKEKQDKIEEREEAKRLKEIEKRQKSDAKREKEEEKRIKAKEKKEKKDAAIMEKIIKEKKNLDKLKAKIQQ